MVPWIIEELQIVKKRRINARGNPADKKKGSLTLAEAPQTRKQAV